MKTRCEFEFSHDFDTQTSIYVCKHCGQPQKVTDEPSPAVCRKTKKTQ